MTLINEIYEFGENGAVSSGDVMSNGGYLVDAQRLIGHQTGIARRELENTALRNISRFCRGVAQFVAEGYAPGVVDDGDVDKIVTGMEASVNGLIGLHNVSAEAHADIRALIAAIAMPGQATGTVAGVIELATSAEVAALADGQRAVTPVTLPAAFPSTNNRIRFPDGTLIQWGTGTCNASGVATVTFPVAFSSGPTLRGVWDICADCTPGAAAYLDSIQVLHVSSQASLTQMGVWAFDMAGAVHATNFYWIAIGKG